MIKSKANSLLECRLEKVIRLTSDLSYLIRFDGFNYIYQTLRKGENLLFITCNNILKEKCLQNYLKIKLKCLKCRKDSANAILSKVAHPVHLMINC